MNSASKLKRIGDGKVFSVTYLAHWSDIKAEDGDTDTVKWMGADLYIGYKGNTYTLLPSETK